MDVPIWPCFLGTADNTEFRKYSHTVGRSPVTLSAGSSPLSPGWLSVLGAALHCSTPWVLSPTSCGYPWCVCVACHSFITCYSWGLLEEGGRSYVLACLVVPLVCCGESHIFFTSVSFIISTVVCRIAPGAPVADPPSLFYTPGCRIRLPPGADHRPGLFGVAPLQPRHERTVVCGGGGGTRAAGGNQTVGFFWSVFWT